MFLEDKSGRPHPLLLEPLFSDRLALNSFVILSVTGPFLAAAVFARERAAARHAAPRSGRELSRPAKVPARIHGRRCGMFRKWRLPSSLWPVTRAISQAMSRVESLNLSETSLQFTCTRAFCDLNPLEMRILSVRRSKGKSISIYFIVLIRKQISNSVSC